MPLIKSFGRKWRICCHMTISSGPQNVLRMCSTHLPGTAFSHNTSTTSRTSTRGIFGYSGASTSEFEKVWATAEKIVGFPPSYLSLRALVSDEISNVAVHMPRLIATNHPLLKTAKRLIHDGRNTLQRRGLIVLLVAKAAAAAPPGPRGPSTGAASIAEEIQPAQRSLAEIVEILHAALLVHRGIINIADLGSAGVQEVAASPSNMDGEKNATVEDLEFGNKMAVLCGDFLLASASVGLSKLGDTNVVRMMAQALGDMVSGEYLALDWTRELLKRGERGAVVGDLNGMVEGDGGGLLELWKRMTLLTTGSLLANACRGVLALGGHSPSLQETAHDVGVNLAFAYQLQQDLASYRDTSTSSSDSGVLGVMSAPVLLHLQHLCSSKPHPNRASPNLGDTKGPLKSLSSMDGNSGGEHIDNDRASGLHEDGAQRLRDLADDAGSRINDRQRSPSLDHSVSRMHGGDCRKAPNDNALQSYADNVAGMLVNPCGDGYVVPNESVSSVGAGLPASGSSGSGTSGSGGSRDSDSGMSRASDSGGSRASGGGGSRASDSARSRATDIDGSRASDIGRSRASDSFRLRASDSGGSRANDGGRSRASDSGRSRDGSPYLGDPLLRMVRDPARLAREARENRLVRVQTQRLCREYARAAKDRVRELPPGPAADALVNIADAICQA